MRQVTHALKSTTHFRGAYKLSQSLASLKSDRLVSLLIYLSECPDPYLIPISPAVNLWMIVYHLSYMADDVRHPADVEKNLTGELSSRVDRGKREHNEG